MTVLASRVLEVPCGFPVNSLASSQRPVFMRVSRENYFSLLKSLIFSLLIHC
jgi:hypothetical protein